MNKNQTFKDGDGEVGVCPVCGSEDLTFEGMRAEDDLNIYPWKCEDCVTEGEEQYTIRFNGHYNKN